MALKKPPKNSGLYIKKLSTGKERYQSRLWNPHLERIGKKKTWHETNLNEVLRKHYQLKQEYQDSGYEIITEPPRQEVKYPDLLVQCAGLYYRYLNDDPLLVPAHKAKHRSKKYIDLTLMYIKRFLTNISDQGIKPSHILAKAITDDHISHFYKDLQEQYDSGEFLEATFNKTIKACKSWFDYLMDLKIIEQNPFTGISLKNEASDPEFAELAELQQFLELITPKNGIGTKGSNFQKVNYYRDWIKVYFLVSVFVGGRRDQMISLTWSDWKGDYIVLDNKKRDHLQNQKGNKVYVYVHPELAELLSTLYQQSKSDKEYILAPEFKNRDSLKSFVTKAFKHYWSLTGSNKRLTLHNLRHTYINAIYNLIGEDGLSVHQKKETAVKHYLSKKKRLELEQGKSLFKINVKSILQN